MSHANVAIIAALSDELAAVRKAIQEFGGRDPISAGTRDRVPRVPALLVRGGVGWESATRAVEKVLDAPHPPGLVYSTGFCGGLTDQARVGDVVLATAILGPDEGQRHSVGPGLAALQKALTGAGLRCHAGAIVSVRLPVTKRDDKRALGAARQALAVDMESFAMAERAGAKAGICVLRVVSDSVDDELPAEISTFLDEHGGVRVGRLARYILGRPANIGVLRALKVRRDRALASLTAAWRVAWPLLQEASAARRR